MADMNWRGPIHFHSAYSYDSMTRIETIVDLLEKNELNFAILTDHNSIAGAVALRDEVHRRKLAIEVPIAAEYKTEHGDLIAAFIERDIKEHSFEAFVAEVRTQSGILLLPHPFQGHKNVELLALECDYVETFNGRTTRQQDRRAAELAMRLGKPAYSGVDSHSQVSVLNAITTLSGSDSLRESLLRLQTLQTEGEPRKCSDWEFHLSQFVKSAKTLDLRLATFTLGRMCKRA